MKFCGNLVFRFTMFLSIFVALCDAVRDVESKHGLRFNPLITRGIKHDFPFVNICKVPREVLKTEGEALRMFMNGKIMFDSYYCINSANHCENEENIGALYFITSSHFPHFPTRVRF